MELLFLNFHNLPRQILCNIDKEAWGKNKLFNSLIKVQIKFRERSSRKNQRNPAIITKISTVTKGKFQYWTKFQYQYVTYTLKCNFKLVHLSVSSVANLRFHSSVSLSFSKKQNKVMVSGNLITLYWMIRPTY